MIKDLYSKYGKFGFGLILAGAAIALFLIKSFSFFLIIILAISGVVISILAVIEKDFKKAGIIILLAALLFFFRIDFDKILKGSSHIVGTISLIAGIILVIWGLVEYKNHNIS